MAFLAERLSRGELVQPELSIKGQKWYRGARELLVQQKFSGLDEFDYCYNSSKNDTKRRSFTDIEEYIKRGTNKFHATPLWSTLSQGMEYCGLFIEYFQKARTLVLSLADEVISKELPVKTELSFAVVADEFEAAKNIFSENSKDEIPLRVAGMLTRVALERHMLTVAEGHSIKIILNPSNKKKHDFNDILNSLEKASAITAIQKSELQSLFKIGNNCSHPNEAVLQKDVERLIIRAQELALVIL